MVNVIWAGKHGLGNWGEQQGSVPNDSVYCCTFIFLSKLNTSDFVQRIAIFVPCFQAAHKAKNVKSV